MLNWRCLGDNFEEISSRQFETHESFQRSGGLITKSCLTLANPWTVAC